MKTKTFLFIIFLMTFFFGILLVVENKKEKIQMPVLNIEIPQNQINKTLQVETQSQPEEIVDWKEENDAKLKIKLLETGDGYHGDQVSAKSGENWLGLFFENGRYFLRKTKLKIKFVNDPVVDESEDIKTGKSVFTNYNAKSVFLLKNAQFIEGAVKTVFYAKEPEESINLLNGFEKSFDFNGETYFLKVENKLNSDEFLGKGSKLVLTKRGTGQILNYLKKDCDDCGWQLYWVGDVDRDGKLDFYFDLSGHYNVSERKLFLSSQAGKGKLVKYAANFWTNGC